MKVSLLDAVVVCGIGLASTVAAQQNYSRPLYPGDTAVVTVPLPLYEQAPEWWMGKHEPTKQKLKVNDRVHVLDRAAYYSLFSREHWFLVQRLCPDEEEQCQDFIGWVLGNEDDQSRLILGVPVPLSSSENREE